MDGPRAAPQPRARPGRRRGALCFGDLPYRRSGLGHHRRRRHRRRQARGDALLLDRPTTFLSADPPDLPGDGAGQRGGFATAEEAITAFAESDRWPNRNWDYAGDCDVVIAGSARQVVCSDPWRGPDVPDRLAPDEHAFLILVAFSDVHPLLALALERSGGRWKVDRIMGPEETVP